MMIYFDSQGDNGLHRFNCKMMTSSFTGGLGIVWVAACIIFIFDSPNEHPRISEKEKKYIVYSLEGNLSKTINVTEHLDRNDVQIKNRRVSHVHCILTF